MKKVLGLLAAGAVVSLALVACKSVQTVTPTTGPSGATTFQTNTVSVLDTNAVIGAIDLVVPTAVGLACQQDSNAAPYFAQAALAMKVLVNNGAVDVASITNSLSKISIRELRTPNAVIAEQAGIAIYQAFAGQVVKAKLDQVQWLSPVLEALANDIQRGVPAN